MVAGEFCSRDGLYGLVIMIYTLKGLAAVVNQDRAASQCLLLSGFKKIPEFWNFMSTPPALHGSKPEGYAGDVEPAETWRVLNDNREAVLVDVRTRAEWGFVGTPDLNTVGKSIILQEWQSFPTMERQASFEDNVVQQLEAAKVDKSAPVFFLCRSGVRSQGAAIALSAAGYECCYNVKDGFEGPKDEIGHRGGTAGWKASQLPWQQQ